MYRRPFRSIGPAALAGALAAVAILLGPQQGTAQSPHDWPVHDEDRPSPPIVEPARQDRPAPPPSDAIILFDGSDLSHWRDGEGPATWKVQDGYMEVVEGTGSLRTRRGFGDVQLHVEWATPLPSPSDGRYRGNSGVYLMDRYEIQVLDSYRDEARIYPDGQAAAVYGQYPPLVNASLPPGEWQTFDIFFRRPRFDADGTVVRPARVTLIHNGVLVQDNVELTGPTAHQARPPYEAHADREPLMLQNHGDAVRFRNIWVRELAETP
jgi:hypothetical protein